MSQLLIKARFSNSDVVRRISIPATSSIEKLKVTIADSFSLFYPFSLKYKDDEGDLISLDSDLELAEAISQANSRSISLLQLTIVDLDSKKSAPKPSATKPAEPSPKESPKSASGHPFLQQFAENNPFGIKLSPEHLEKAQAFLSKFLGGEVPAGFHPSCGSAKPAGAKCPFSSKSAPPSTTSTAPSSPAPSPAASTDVDNMSVKQLKDLLRSKGVTDFSGVVEKRHLLDLLRNTSAAASAPTPSSGQTSLFTLQQKLAAARKMKEEFESKAKLETEAAIREKELEFKKQAEEKAQAEARAKAEDFERKKRLEAEELMKRVAEQLAAEELARYKAEEEAKKEAEEARVKAEAEEKQRIEAQLQAEAKAEEERKKAKEAEEARAKAEFEANQAKRKALEEKIAAEKEREATHPFAQKLNLLESMGFSDRAKNIEALVKSGGQIVEAVQTLLSQ